MKKLLIILLSIFSLTAFAQQPNWYSESERASNYPKSSYFTGIAYGEVQRGEAAGKAMERLKNAARVEALSTINTHVQNETTNHSHSESFESVDTWSETIRETMDSRTTTTVDMEIPGLQVEAWKNPNNNEVVAFAYVKKSTLIRQMEKKITVSITKVETALDQVNEMINQGQKMQARESIKRLVPLFQELEQAQRILIAVDPMSDEESLQLAETKQLSQRYTRMAADLRNGINIYLTCTAKLFSANFPTLKAEIQGELSKLGVSFVSNAAQADWIVTVNAAAREYNSMAFGSTTTYFAYVDINIAIEKKATGQRIYENEISEKGGHTKNFDYAAREAYKTLTPQVSAIIKEHIQQ